MAEDDHHQEAGDADKDPVLGLGGLDHVRGDQQMRGGDSLKREARRGATGRGEGRPPTLGGRRKVRGLQAEKGGQELIVEREGREVQSPNLKI